MVNKCEKHNNSFIHGSIKEKKEICLEEGQVR